MEDYLQSNYYNLITFSLRRSSIDGLSLFVPDY
nr:MAG TPA: hypothetical protein [Crassvirales sp.]